ncbi:putative membrane protein [Arthrobacter pigmenti]|uniref:Putative membrane protein n=1 Tax=Arthrobacter pigmenti TaxID=271432 RepID=A0A846RV75_9MICC|nr:phage holin family protein [Arthrobacter pigmenti]NJC24067.1 putative membrane protein [Arthrobacter pigmenti]
MLKFIVRVLINALALWVAAWLLPGIELGSEAATEASGNDTVGSILSYLFVGLVFGVVNALVRPIVSLLSLPLTILTLGLFTIVINAGMLMLTSWLTSFTPIGFTVDDFFWTAILGAIIISLVSLVAGAITGNSRR